MRKFNDRDFIKNFNRRRRRMKVRENVLKVLFCTVAAGAAGAAGVLIFSDVEVLTDVDGTKNALRGMGLTPINVGGYTPYGCSQDDVYHTKFTARNLQGEIFTGVGCSAPFKGTNIKFL